MIYALWISLIFVFLMLAGDAALSEIGTRRGIAQEADELPGVPGRFQQSDRSFNLTAYCTIHAPLFGVMSFATGLLIWRPYYPEGWVMVAVNTFLGLYHLKPVIAWLKLFGLFVVILCLAACPRRDIEYNPSAEVEQHNCVNSCPRGWVQQPWPDCTCKNPVPAPF